MNVILRKTPTVAFACTLSLVVGSSAHSEPNVAGHWEGQIHTPDQPLKVGVDLAHSNGSWSGTIDIPEQDAKGLPLSRISIKGSEDSACVKFAIPEVPGNPTFEGHLGGDVISGQFTQAGASFGFRLSRKTIVGPKRPQEREPPYSYEVEEVRFENGPVSLAGTLTIPRGEGPFPAALLISGSGLQDRDSTLFGHRPFWVIADYLTQAGIAVLRVDDAGIGESTSHPEPPTTAVFAADADAGVAFLEQDDRINGVGLIGHSEGGVIAAMIASSSENIAFVVLLAGLGVPGAKLLRKQNERIFDATDIAGTPKKTLLATLDQLFATIIAEMTETERRQQVEDLIRQQFEVHGVPAVSQNESRVQAMVEQALSPWMRYFLAFDPYPALAATKAPVLALNGDLDVQVDAEQNLTAIANALQEGGNRNVTVHRLPGHNHLFQRARTGLVSEYTTIEETISPEVLNLIRDWILTISR